MRQALTLHPDYRCPAVHGIEVDVARAAPAQAGTRALVLRYLVTGDPGALLLPPPAAPERAEELWRTTCFEVFARAGADEGYVEFNFAPSTQWAAYRFDGYRSGMRALATAAPVIATASAAGRYELAATLVMPDAAGRLALSAVIETVDGGKSYWALAHPPGKPDFHHACAFTFDLSTTEQP